MRLTRSLCLVLALLAAASPLLAAGPPWVPLGPFGGTVQHLTADPSTPGVVYATAGAEGAFKSTDHGATWTALIGQPALGAVAVDPSRPATLYLPTNQVSLLKSTDGGATWAPANQGLPGGTMIPSAVAVDPNRPSRVYAVSGRTFWRSLNGGLSWQNLGKLPAGSVHALAAPRRPAGLVLAATSQGVFRSRDAGATWKPGQGLPAATVAALAIAPSDPRTVYAALPGRGIYRSVDSGASWQPLRRQPASLAFAALAVSSRSPRVLVAGGLSGLYRSADGGASWSRVGPAVLVASLAADPFDGRTFWTGLNISTGPELGGVLRSLDGGVNWTRTSRGISALTASVGVPSAGDPGTLWAGLGVKGLFRSANQGLRWARVPMPPASGARPRASVDAFSASTALARMIVDNLTFPELLTTFWKTEDGGAGWTLSLGPNTDPPLPHLGLTFADPSAPFTLYVLDTVGDERPLLRTTDAGDSWRLVANVPLDCAFGDAAVAPSNPDVLYAAGSAAGTLTRCQPQQPGLLRSTDGGVTWINVTGPFSGEVVKAVAVDPLDEDLVYAGIGPELASQQGDGVWRSPDGGATWQRAGAELAGRPVTELLASAVPGRVYAVVDENRVYRSDDGGDTWEEWSERLKALRIFRLHADPSDPDRVYASTTNGIWLLEED